MIAWTCLGAGPRHDADIEPVESVGRHGRSQVSIDRCRACGQLYRYETFEVSDWGPNGDYYAETFVWKPLAPDEVALLRQAPSYTPRDERSFMHQPGWRSA